MAILGDQYKVIFDGSLLEQLGKRVRDGGGEYVHPSHTNKPSTALLCRVYTGT
jgi:hypothetical protein